jgi:hypothetical protein
MGRKHLGSSFDGFLKEEGIHEEVKRQAKSRLVAFQFLDRMKKTGCIQGCHGQADAHEPVAS